MTTIDKKTKVGRGLFGFENRNPLSIIKAQEKFMGTKKLYVSNIKKLDKYGICQDQDLKDLIYKMMETNPKDRISPKDILNHPYCQFW